MRISVDGKGEIADNKTVERMNPDKLDKTMTVKRKNRFPELKRLAKKHNCEVFDDKDSCIIQVNALPGWSWDNGEVSCQWTGYGESVSEWRHDAIEEAIERLAGNPPECKPYKYEED